MCTLLVYNAVCTVLLVQCYLYSTVCTVFYVQCCMYTVIQSHILTVLMFQFSVFFSFYEVQKDVFLSVTSGNLSGVTTTTQRFDWHYLNNENITEYLQNHLDTHVGTLSLRCNQLTDLSWVSEFSQLDTLKVLHVGGNRIESFSWDDIPPLTEEIDLWENNLVSLPHIGKHNTCVHVKTLDLDNNQLENMDCSHIPHTVVTLYLSYNNMKTLCDMSHLQLTELYLHYNQLENMECSHIPHTVVTLYLSYNNMKTVCDMSHLQLTELYLHYNQLENIECSHIPHTVVTLDLSYNNMSSQNFICITIS